MIPLPPDQKPLHLLASACIVTVWLDRRSKLPDSHKTNSAASPVQLLPTTIKYFREQEARTSEFSKHITNFMCNW